MHLATGTLVVTHPGDCLARWVLGSLPVQPKSVGSATERGKRRGRMCNHVVNPPCPYFPCETQKIAEAFAPRVSQKPFFSKAIRQQFLSTFDMRPLPLLGQIGHTFWHCSSSSAEWEKKSGGAGKAPPRKEGEEVGSFMAPVVSGVPVVDGRGNRESHP